MPGPIERADAIPDAPPPRLWPAALIAGVILAVVMLPPLRAPLVWALSGLGWVASAILPGSDWKADVAVAAQALGWLGLALSPLFLLPLLTLGAPVVGAKPADVIARAARRVATAIDAVSHRIGRLAQWVGLALILVVASVAVQRYVFDVAFTKLQESVLYLHAAAFLLMIPATLAADGHVRVDVLYGRFGPRTRAGVNIVGTYLLLVPLALLVLLTSLPYVERAWGLSVPGAQPEASTQNDGLAFVFLLKTLIPAFAILLLIQGLAVACHAALALIGREASPAPEHHEGV